MLVSLLHLFYCQGIFVFCLKGPTGSRGNPGFFGMDGTPGKNGAKGAKGAPGNQGKAVSTQRYFYVCKKNH